MTQIYGGTLAAQAKGTAPNPIRILEQRLRADPSRVVLRPFHLGWQATNAPQDRATSLVQAVAQLSDAKVASVYAKILEDFQDRHWQTEHIFEARYRELKVSLDLEDGEFSAERRKLIGAYFCQEYTYAAAALMNPSIVPHPDQTGMVNGSVRFILSLRAVGEGHISSIAFREGIANIDGSFDLWPENAFATTVQRIDNCAQGDDDCPVVVERHCDSSLSNTVIFPITEQQANGLEDLRLVRFDHGEGDFEWLGTYTAYSGHSIRSEMLRTRDFRTFALAPIKGRAARNKGMALFPQNIDGRYAMIGRQDGKNLYLLRSDRLDSWDDDGVLLMGPEYSWEFIQIGNCGSPILTDAGWLVITHGVGAMRKYALGCVLLDRDDPSRVLARTPEPILTAQDADRAGYVPNVVYTCGAMLLGPETLLIPYGISDIAVGFATAQVSDLLALMR
ncbi:MAG: glycoside hydrolase family 130 protein [Novosphingobium sp.]